MVQLARSAAALLIVVCVAYSSAQTCREVSSFQLAFGGKLLCFVITPTIKPAASMPAVCLTQNQIMQDVLGTTIDDVRHSGVTISKLDHQ